MEFDVVIVTRNRAAALRVSLPLILSQDRLPGSLIIVDSSRDHAEVKSALGAILTRSPNSSKVRTEIIRSPSGITVQRNIGLSRVESPIVFFPDDDSLWFPGAAESVMRVYEKDQDAQVGSVCLAESFTPPIPLFSETVQYRMTFLDRFKLFYDPHFDKLESSFFPDPLRTAGKSIVREKPLSIRNGLDDVEECWSLTGFRMTFRTEVIRGAGGFDEALGRYSLFEDRDSALRVLKTHAILCARAARVFHYRSPEKRTSGFEFGMMNILNRAYVICKNFDLAVGVGLKTSLQRFLLFKLFRYAAQSYSKYGRERFLGACRAYFLLPHLFRASGEQLAHEYARLKRRCISR